MMVGQMSSIERGPWPSQLVIPCKWQVGTDTHTVRKENEDPVCTCSQWADIDWSQLT